MGETGFIGKKTSWFGYTFLSYKAFEHNNGIYVLGPILLSRQQNILKGLVNQINFFKAYFLTFCVDKHLPKLC